MVDQRRPAGREQPAHEAGNNAEADEARIRRGPIQRLAPHGQLQAGSHDDKAECDAQRVGTGVGQPFQQEVADDQNRQACHQDEAKRVPGDMAPAAVQDHLRGVHQR